MKRKFWIKSLLGFGFLCLLFLIARPVFHLTKTAWNDKHNIPPTALGKLDDASHLNETSVAQLWQIPADRDAAEKQLAALLQTAHANHLKVSIAGARHSMGGHVISPGGIVIDMLPFNRMELDATNRLLRVQAGARWSEVIPILNAQGLSVEVMQSNDDFSVGGSVSVNCHGWQFNRPPIASTVESFRLMLADGNIVQCSRTQNRELFSLALGGYGLFGIILDVDLRVVPNETYQIERLTISASDYINTLAKKTADSNNIAMVYGRLSVTSDKFLQEGILNVYNRLSTTNRLVSELSEPKNRRFQRAIFRGGVGSEYGKELRWSIEKHFSRVLSEDIAERNVVLCEPSAWFKDHSTTSTDILMECFVPPDKFSALLEEFRKIIPRHTADLLNITVRDINCDKDSFLRYADQNMISLVMLFSQTRSEEGDNNMSKLTQEMITATLRYKGRYYLPYRLHATPEQFHQAYPQAKEFFELKRKHDPDELFQNGFYQKYGK